MARVGGRRWRRLLAQVIAEEGGICHICRLPGATSGDHVIPVSKRPDLEFERWNIRACHRLCNTKRGNRPVPAWPAIKTTRAW